MSHVWEGRLQTRTVSLLRPNSSRPTPCRPHQGPPPRGTLPPLSPTGHRGDCWRLRRAGWGHHSERARGRLKPAPRGDVLLDPRGREYLQRGPPPSGMATEPRALHGPLLAALPLPSDARQEGTAGSPAPGPVASNVFLFSPLSVFPRRHCQSRDSRVSQQVPGRWDPGCGRGGVVGGAVLGEELSFGSSCVCRVATCSLAVDVGRVQGRSQFHRVNSQRGPRETPGMRCTGDQWADPRP